MAFVPIHGARALIYLDGTEMTAANAYSLTADHAAADTPVFGDTWMKRCKGIMGATGNINAWLSIDQKLLNAAATKAAGASTSVMLYPNRTVAANLLSCSAYFGVGWAGDTGGPQSNTGAFSVDGAVTVTGFS